MSDDIGPYGVTQNPDVDAVTANALVGERAGNVTAHQTNDAYSPASFSTAPYQAPKPVPLPPKPSPPVAKRVVEVRPPATQAVEPTCRHKDCKQPAVAGFQYCGRHP